MRPNFVAVLFVFWSAVGCDCGLVGWFNEWTDQLEPENTHTKCRERREVEENGITPEITSSQDKIVSLLDVENGEDNRTAESGRGRSKTKRCPILGITRSSDSVLGQPRMNIENQPLVKRESQDQYLLMCNACRKQPTCRILKKCDECNKYCKHVSTFTNEALTSWNNPSSSIVGMKNRMAQVKNDIFSKTLYPISTYREGEIKNIICRIIGINDASDIETVTIWVTTFSNNPPKEPSGLDEFNNKDPRRQENLAEQKLKAEPNQLEFNGGKTDKSGSPQSSIQSRFNDDDLEDTAEPRELEDKIKENPDLIEGAPEFLRNSAVPDLSSDKNIIGTPNKEIIVQPKEFESEESDEDETLPMSEVQSSTETSTAEKLMSLTTARSFRKLSGGDTKKPAATGGFLQNLLKSRQAQLQKALSPTEDPVKQISEKNMLSEINESLQEVKAMVENMKEEAQKASEKRLLGAPELPQNDQIQSPNSKLVDNFKDVNKYFAQRAQDALNIIDPDKNKNLKKMPEFLLDKFKNTIDGVESKPQEPSTIEDGKVMARFGEADTNTNPGEPIVGEAESDDGKTYKNKLEKYLAELKEKRQKLYSPEKYSKIISPEGENEVNVQPKSADRSPESQKEILKEKLRNYITNLKKPEASTESNIPTLTTENSNLILGEYKAPEQLESSTISQFLPTVPTTAPIVPNTFKKYIDDIKAKRPLTAPQVPDTKRDQLKDKIKQYVENMKKANIEKPTEIIPRNFKEQGVGNSNQELLKNKLKDYVSSLRRPMESRSSAPELVRKSPEVQKEELKALKNKLDDLMKERMSKIPTLLKNSPGQTLSTNTDIDKPNESLISETKDDLLSEPSPLEEELTLRNRAGFAGDNDVTEWSNSLGKIIQSSSEPQDIFFVGNGIKLPLQVNKSPDGSMDLSVDLDKLCSCSNVTCPKNDTAIEETVSTILEKEAELKDQLDSGKEKTNIFKRELEIGTTESVLKLPSIEQVVSQVDELGGKVQKYFADSIQRIQEVNEDIKEKMKIAQPDALTQTMQKLEHQKALNDLLSKNKGVNTNLNAYIKQLEREKALKKLLKQLEQSQVPAKQVLKQIEAQANAILKEFEPTNLKGIPKPPSAEQLSNQLKKNLKHGVREINDNFLRMQDAYQYTNVDALQNKLKKLDKEAEKYQENNGKLLAKESKKLLGGKSNKVYQKEADILSNVFSWFKDITKSSNEV